MQDNYCIISAAEYETMWKQQIVQLSLRIQLSLSKKKKKENLECSGYIKEKILIHILLCSERNLNHWIEYCYYGSI